MLIYNEFAHKFTPPPPTNFPNFQAEKSQGGVKFYYLPNSFSSFKPLSISFNKRL